MAQRVRGNSRRIILHESLDVWVNKIKEVLQIDWVQSFEAQINGRRGVNGSPLCLTSLLEEIQAGNYLDGAEVANDVEWLARRVKKATENSKLGNKAFDVASQVISRMAKKKNHTTTPVAPNPPQPTGNGNGNGTQKTFALIGNIDRVTKDNQYHSAFAVGEQVFHQGDFVYLYAPNPGELPYIGRICSIWRSKLRPNDETSWKLEVQWFYRLSDLGPQFSTPEKVPTGFNPSEEIFVSSMKDVNPLATVMDSPRCEVEFVPEGARPKYTAGTKHSFFYRYRYTPQASKILERMTVALDGEQKQKKNALARKRKREDENNRLKAEPAVADDKLSKKTRSTNNSLNREVVPPNESFGLKRGNGTAGFENKTKEKEREREKEKDAEKSPRETARQTKEEEQSDAVWKLTSEITKLKAIQKRSDQKILDLNAKLIAMKQSVMEERESNAKQLRELKENLVTSEEVNRVLEKELAAKRVQENMFTAQNAVYESRLKELVGQ